jgi:hypothetical protein
MNRAQPHRLLTAAAVLAAALGAVGAASGPVWAEPSGGGAALPAAVTAAPRPDAGAASRAADADLAARAAGTRAAPAAPAPAHPAPGDPDLGPNVYVFDPSMPTAQIQATADAIAARQVDDEMGTGRYAMLFKPGHYGSAATPLVLRVGYYTEVAGLGRSPSDVTITGHVDVYNRCLPADDPNSTFCIALNNFWRSMSNLTIEVAGSEGCHASGEFWAVSQAAPMRRVDVTGGNLTLMDYCSGPAWASGGFIADSRTGFVINGSQQQWYSRDSSFGGWSNGVWNQVFSGVQGAPGQCFPGDPSCGGPYTTLDSTPVSREKPYLYVDAAGSWNVFVPPVRTGSSGPSWTAGPTPGRSVPLADVTIVRPGDSVASMDAQLAQGRHLLFTPGVYDIGQTIHVRRPDTVVLGLGLPTLTASGGATVLATADVPGVDLAGFMVDAGPANSALLMRIGTGHAADGTATDHNGWSDAADPTALHDVFFRIGGPHVGRATVTLQVDADHVVLDDIWAWRADHGVPGSVGWTVNTADTGLVVNGDDVTATGLFVEHFQKDEVVWNGERGRVLFFQNEMPYDPPSQAAWMDGTTKGYAALKVADRVRDFRGWGMGSYSFFNQGVDIYADRAFAVPTTLPAGSLRDLLTIFLDPVNGSGGILHVVNDAGGSSTIANPDVVVPVVSYP